MKTPTTPDSQLTATWSIPPERKEEYEKIFKDADTACAGYLDGARVRDLLVPSGLSAQDLGHIWRLSSLRKTKSLDITEFSIAKHLVDHKLSNRELPDITPLGLIPFGMTFP
jgi:hypothetical protein